MRHALYMCTVGAAYNSQRGFRMIVYITPADNFSDVSLCVCVGREGGGREGGGRVEGGWREGAREGGREGGRDVIIEWVSGRRVEMINVRSN